MKRILKTLFFGTFSVLDTWAAIYLFQLVPVSDGPFHSFLLGIAAGAVFFAAVLNGGLCLANSGISHQKSSEK